MGRPMLRYKDVIKRDLRSALIDISAWEDIANHRDTWRQSVKAVVSKAEANARVQATCKGAARKERAVSARDSAGHVCTTCNRDCHSRIGLHSHTRSCPNPSANHRLFETRMPLILLLLLLVLLLSASPERTQRPLKLLHTI